MIDMLCQGVYTHVALTIEIDVGHIGSSVDRFLLYIKSRCGAETVGQWKGNGVVDNLRSDYEPYY